MRYLDRDFFVPEDLDHALLRVAAGVAGIREATAQRDGPSRLLVREVWRPRWTYLVAIVLFPIGLLALLIKSEATLVVDATAADSGTQLRLHGKGHEVVCDAVLATLKTAAAPLAVRE